MDHFLLFLSEEFDQGPLDYHLPAPGSRLDLVLRGHQQGHLNLSLDHLPAGWVMAVVQFPPPLLAHSLCVGRSMGDQQ